MKKFPCFFISVVFLCLSGCSIAQNGTNLHAFTERMNKLSDSYSLTESGYIFDRESNSLSKFYNIGSTEYLLCLELDKNNNISSINIVFDEINTDNSEELKFIENCIYAYINNNEVTDKLLTASKLKKVLQTKEPINSQEKIGNTEIIIDVTETGTVITIEQNNP